MPPGALGTTLAAYAAIVVANLSVRKRRPRRLLHFGVTEAKVLRPGHVFHEHLAKLHALTWSLQPQP